MALKLHILAKALVLAQIISDSFPSPPVSYSLGELVVSRTPNCTMTVGVIQKCEKAGVTRKLTLTDEHICARSICSIHNRRWWGEPTRLFFDHCGITRCIRRYLANSLLQWLI